MLWSSWQVCANVFSVAYGTNSYFQFERKKAFKIQIAYRDMEGAFAWWSFSMNRLNRAMTVGIVDSKVNAVYVCKGIGI